MMEVTAPTVNNKVHSMVTSSLVTPSLINLFRRTLLSLFICAIGSACFISTANAQPVSSPRPSVKATAASGRGEKRTTVNFEDQLIEGQTQKPELFYFLQQRNSNFKRLIKLRENFLPEMRKTAEDVSRSKGSAASGSAN